MMTFDEIAKELGVSRGVVQKDYYSGMEKLRSYFREHPEVAGAFFEYLESKPTPTYHHSGFRWVDWDELTIEEEVDV